MGCPGKWVSRLLGAEDTRWDEPARPPCPCPSPAARCHPAPWAAPGPRAEGHGAPLGLGLRGHVARSVFGTGARRDKVALVHSGSCLMASCPHEPLLLLSIFMTVSNT